MKQRIFYSWQSDLPNNTNRGFIENALEKAISEINSDDSFTMIPFLDRDTAGLTGSPDISATIFNKIDDSSVFVCDVSIINGISDGVRSTPNPNVLIELGYAVSKLGWSNIILIINDAYGGVELLPFDLRGRKVLVYTIDSETSDKSTERKKVSSILKKAVGEILSNLSSQKHKAIKLAPSSSNGDSNISYAKSSKSKLKVILNISNLRKRNDELIKETESHIQANRHDLAVDYALKINNLRKKNDFLIQIANTSIENRDVTTSEKAIGGISNPRIRNELSMKILGAMD